MWSFTGRVPWFVRSFNNIFQAIPLRLQPPKAWARAERLQLDSDKRSKTCGAKLADGKYHGRRNSQTRWRRKKSFFVVDLSRVHEIDQYFNPIVHAQRANSPFQKVPPVPAQRFFVFNFSSQRLWHKQLCWTNGSWYPQSSRPESFSMWTPKKVVLLMATRNPVNSPVEGKVVYPIIYKVFSTIPRWLALGFLNHQQYVLKLVKTQVSGVIPIPSPLVWLPAEWISHQIKNIPGAQIIPSSTMIISTKSTISYQISTMSHHDQINQSSAQIIPSLKLTFSPLKMDG